MSSLSEEKKIEIINKIRDSITDNENIYLLCDSLEDIIKNNKHSYNIQLVVSSLLNYIDKLQKELDKYKRLAEANLKDSQEFQENMCNHRCIKNNEVLELKEEIVELQKENAKLRNTNEILYETGKQNAIQELLNENWVSKNKIRAEIKELEEMEVYGVLFETGVNFAIRVLKELLGGDRDE